ncbi:MAG: class I SAM-dependent methyltransferase [Hyphomicrobium sp.]|nr:class I SAM-dependent methyltransferase [Hyphomicrobium sp.]
MTGQHPGRASGTPNGIQGYGETADVLVKQYESRSFADVHRGILRLLPPAPARALDIGAGTGRDAAALAALGHTVLAVEPTPEMRAHGQRLHPSPAIEWLDDSLPELARVRARGQSFDLVMITAVWMHLDQVERLRAMACVAELIAPGGLMTLSLRHGPVPAGRRMFDVGPAETRALAGHHGLTTIFEKDRPSVFNADGVWWDVLAFRA